MLETIEQFIESMTANVKLFDKAMAGLEESYVELLTLLALGLLAVVPVIVPKKRRQAFRHINQIFGIAIFVFVVFTCLGVFGMIRNFYRGLGEIGRENIVALYFCAVPVTVMATAMLFGPTFCGWICPTGALQEFVGMIVGRRHLEWKKAGYPFSRRVLGMTLLVAAVFMAWVAYLTATRIFFFEDATIYWAEAIVLLLFLLVWRMREWDRPLRRLRVLSFAIVAAAALTGIRISSPVHFGFSKIYDPASVMATVIVVLATLAVPRIWCRYLCPWREAIAWAGRHSVRRLVTNHDLCIHCGKCDDACYVDAVTEGRIDPRECHMCMKCVDVCPTEAITIEDRWCGGCDKSRGTP